MKQTAIIIKKISGYTLFIIFLFILLNSGWTQSKQSTPQKGAPDIFQLYTVLVGKQPYGFLGQSLAADADLNSDGQQDMVIGANGAGPSRQGVVYIFSRNSYTDVTDPATAEVQIVGEKPGDQFGWALTTRGDFNGDGQKDLVVAALKTDHRGQVYIFEGGKIPAKGQVKASSANHVIISKDSTETFGFVVSADGDINGDGISDLVISAPSNSALGKEAGKVYIFQGGGWGDTLWTDDAACVITGEKEYDHLGSSITCGGNIIGDKINDLVIGAFFSSQDSMNGGRGYVLEGRRLWEQQIPAAQADLIIGNSAPESWLGTAAEIIGDINGDEKDELLISASGKYIHGDDAGAVFLFYGGKKKGKVSVQNADMTFTSGRTGNNFGTSIVRTGDIDGDNKEDWIISEPGGTVPGKDYYGRIYLFPTSFLSRNDFSNVIEEPIPNNYFGKSISVGDINGDGKKEIIAGAFNDNSGGQKGGKVVVFKIIPFKKK